MTDFTSVLVLTDFSESSDKAARAGFDLARKYEADLAFLHVMEDRTSLFFSLSDSEYHNLQRKQEKQAQKALEAMDASIEGLYGFPNRKKLRRGIPYIQCLEEVEEGNYDLVVMASHGVSNLQDMFMGSTAAKVLRRAPISVFVVR